jgi:hypothetical protein
MSKQQFSNDLRMALWEAYDRTCFHCRKPLLFAHVKIDHLLPESLMKRDKKRTGLFKDFGLPSTFDLRGHENLVPSCEGCNSKRADIVLPSAKVGLAKASNSVSKVRDILEQQSAARILGGALGIIATAMSNGTYAKDTIAAEINCIPVVDKKKRPTCSGETPEDFLKFTAIAQDALTASGLSLKNLADKVRQPEAWSDASAVTSQGEPGQYVLRLADNLSIYFSVQDKQVVVNQFNYL